MIKKIDTIKVINTTLNNLNLFKIGEQITTDELTISNFEMRNCII
jgi:hypothetical protein